MPERWMNRYMKKKRRVGVGEMDQTVRGSCINRDVDETTRGGMNVGRRMLYILSVEAYGAEEGCGCGVWLMRILMWMT